MVNRNFHVTAADGYALDIKLSEPDTGEAGKLVVFVNASGPFTCDTKRNYQGKDFNYFDLFAEEFTKRNISFCRYATRGVKDGDTPPFFVDIDDAEYKTYLPHNSVSDVACIIQYLTTAAYKDAKILLLGWSEGSIIAPLIALNKNVKVDALLLAGYCNENLRDILIWQLSGNLMLMTLRRVFDTDKKGYITKEELEEDKFKVRQETLGDASFEELDRNGDGKIDASDLAYLTKDHRDGMLRAIERGDDKWMKKNHKIRLTTGWLKEHFELEPNNRVLPRLDIPIHIFAGEYDANTPIQFAYDIRQTFEDLGKTNLTIHTFDGHDHDLNYLLYIIKGVIPDGILEIFKTAEAL